jgi:hypothetical protein
MNIPRMGLAAHPETGTKFESVAVLIVNKQTYSFFARGMVFSCEEYNQFKRKARK